MKLTKRMYICSSNDGKPAHVLGDKCDNPDHNGHWVQEFIPGSVALTWEEIRDAVLLDETNPFVGEIKRRLGFE